LLSSILPAMPVTDNGLGLRARTNEIIFGHDTPAGKAFDVALIWFIILSVVVVMLESVETVRLQYGALLRQVEWGFTVVFTIEYVSRLWCVERPMRYARSFFGIVDLLAILPTYLSVLLPGGQALLTVRLLRLLRVFRVLKLAHHVAEAMVLMRALRASRDKLTVFIATILTMVVIMGSMMYLIEGAQNGFTSIPRSVYWAIVTLTTVGYGDIVPQTPIGQALAAVIMIMGYSIIAVPTGIVTVELSQEIRRLKGGKACGGCGADGHDGDARYCRRCGEPLGES
jgi:voltage-gated potassium channel